VSSRLKNAKFEKESWVDETPEKPGEAKPCKDELHEGQYLSTKSETVWLTGAPTHLA